MVGAGRSVFFILPITNYNQDKNCLAFQDMIFLVQGSSSPSLSSTFETDQVAFMFVKVLFPCLACILFLKSLHDMGPERKYSRPL